MSTPCWAGRCLWKAAHLPRWRGIIRTSLGSWGISSCVPCSSTPVKLWRQVTLRRLSIACRSYDTVGLHVYKPLGAQSHGPYDPCLRFAAEVTLVPRKTRLRLATCGSSKPHLNDEWTPMLLGRATCHQGLTAMPLPMRVTNGLRSCEGSPVPFGMVSPFSQPKRRLGFRQRAARTCGASHRPWASQPRSRCHCQSQGGARGHPWPTTNACARCGSSQRTRPECDEGVAHRG